MTESYQLFYRATEGASNQDESIQPSSHGGKGVQTVDHSQTVVLSDPLGQRTVQSICSRRACTSTGSASQAVLVKWTTRPRVACTSQAANKVVVAKECVYSAYDRTW